MKLFYTGFAILAVAFGLNAQDFDIRVVAIDQPANQGECGHIGIQVKFNDGYTLKTNDQFLGLTYSLAYDKTKVDISNIDLDETTNGKNTLIPASAAVQSPLDLTASFPNPDVEFTPVSNIAIGNNLGFQIGSEWVTVQVFDFFVNGGCSAIKVDVAQLFDIANRTLVGDYNDPQLNINNEVLRGEPQMVPGGPLMTDLFMLTAERFEDNSSLLKWETQNNPDADFFRVERSLDNETWQYIGRVEAASDQVERAYQFTDRNVFDARRLEAEFSYRVVMVDRAGAPAISNVEDVQFQAEPVGGAVKLMAYPNPSVDGLNVEIHQGTEASAKQMELVNTLGQLVFSRELAEGTEIEYIDYATIDLKSGAYVLRVTDNDGQILGHETVVVNR